MAGPAGETERLIIAVAPLRADAAIARRLHVAVLNVATPLEALACAGLAPQETPIVLAARRGAVDPDLPRALGSLAPGARIVEFHADDPADGLLCESRLRALSAPSAAPIAPHPAPGPPRDEPSRWDEESAVAAALLSGEHPLSLLISIAQRRLQCGDLEFVSPGTPPREGGARATVAHAGRVLGQLVSRAVPPEDLASAAGWMGRWLALAEQNEQLRAASLTDPLTGAWNRRYFERFLDAALERARERRHDVTLMLLDLDNFKKYNDDFGHAAGDLILCETVRLLRSVIRPTDRVCRIGGDEFAVIFDEPAGPRDPRSRHPATAQEIARRFQRQILAHRFPKLGNQAPGPLSVSAGLATFPWDAPDARTLTEKADLRLLDAKRQGKNALALGPDHAADPVDGR